MFKSALKILAWIIGAFLALVIAVYLVFLVVNLHDQPPSELAQQFESTYKNRIKIADEENAAIYVMGLSVAQNEDPKLWGAKRFALVSQATDDEIGKVGQDPIFEDYRYRDVRSASVVASSDLFNIPLAENVFTKLSESKDTIAEWSSQEEWLLKRYLELLTYKKYQEYAMTDPAAPLPSYGAVIDAQKLFFANLWLQAEQGNAENIKHLLEQDAVCWRMVLASTDTLISKMIAVAALKRHFVFGNLVLKKLSMKTSVNGMPENWKLPFTQAESSMLQTFSGEWMFQDHLFKKIKHEPDDYFYTMFFQDHAHWFTDLFLAFLQPQVESNKAAENFKNLIDVLNVPLHEYVDAIDDAENEHEEQKELQTNKNDPYIYNATGSYLRSRSEAEYGSYFIYFTYSSRVNDLEGARQAAVLITEIRNQSLAPEAVPDFISHSTYHNPYTLKPFEWDVESKAVKFTGLEEGERGIYSFAL